MGGCHGGARWGIGRLKNGAGNPWNKKIQKAFAGNKTMLKKMPTGEKKYSEITSEKVISGKKISIHKR